MGYKIPNQSSQEFHLHSGTLKHLLSFTCSDAYIPEQNILELPENTVMPSKENQVQR